jgi:nucleoside-diphosphate-sugar epimerase
VPSLSGLSGQDTSSTASPVAAAKLKGLGAVPVRGNLADTAVLERSAREADAVVHLAQPRFDFGGDFAAQMQESGRLVAGAVNAYLKGLHDSGKALVLTGGTGAYGDTGDRIVDETTPVLASPLTAALAENERKVLSAPGVRGMVVRPGIVYGRGGGPVLMQLAMTQASGKAYVVGDGLNALSFVHVDDVAELYLLMLERGESGLLLNAVAEPFVTQKALMQAVSEVAGLGGVTEPMPEEQVQRGGGYGIFSRTMRVSGARARAFSWSPTRPDLLAELRSGAYKETAA